MSVGAQRKYEFSKRVPRLTIKDQSSGNPAFGNPGSGKREGRDIFYLVILLLHVRKLRARLNNRETMQASKQAIARPPPPPRDSKPTVITPGAEYIYISRRQ
jgi:hypothetical protein